MNRGERADAIPCCRSFSFSSFRSAADLRAADHPRSLIVKSTSPKYQKPSRYPEHMATIEAAKARTLPERIGYLETAMAGLPPWDRYQWLADTKQAFGDKRVRAHVVGDDGYGEGRQWIATVPGDKSFGTLADYIAAANPATIRLLIDRIAELEAKLSVERFSPAPT